MKDLYDTRNERLHKNTICSLTYQVVTVASGFVLPKLFLLNYNSSINGLVDSIKNFLQVISFMEFGIGSVVQANLYEPLAFKNNKKISQVYSASNKFFKKIALAFCIYIFIVCIFFPLFVKNQFGIAYTVSLILVMGVSIFTQYYLSMTNRILLLADQKGYIYYNIQTATLLINTIVSVAIVKMGASIHVVELVTAIIYLLRPVALVIYVKHHYEINEHILYKEEPIKQKWNGIMQHVSYFILSQTDIIVLTIFSDLKNVSIYSVYNMVVLGVEQVLVAATDGFQPLLGELYAKKENNTLCQTFYSMKKKTNMISVVIFGCTFLLIVPFIGLYTRGITDANYLQPTFASLLVISHFVLGLRIPYHTMIKAAGKFKETQWYYFYTAIINLICSIILVNKFGLIGITSATLLSIIIQTFCLMIYCYKHLISFNRKLFVQQFVSNLFTVTFSIFVCSLIEIKPSNYFQWTGYAAIIFIIFLSISNLISAFFKILYKSPSSRSEVK